MWLTIAKKKKSLNPYRDQFRSVSPSLIKEHNTSNKGKDQGGQLYDIERTQHNTTDFREERHEGDAASENLQKTFGVPGVDYMDVWPIDVCANKKWLKN
jgi:hypothetical protein